MSHIKELSRDFTRGVIFGAGLSVGIGAIVLSSIAFASSTGGKFGLAIDAILETGRTWQSPGDGMVKNAAMLSGALTPDKLLKIKNNGGCPSGQAINKIQADGTITCVSIVKP